MKLNNKGFALTSIIYMLIVLFLMILLLILANLATRKVVLDKLKNDVKYKLNQGISVNVADLPYQNTTTRVYYGTLEEAFSSVQKDQENTIKVLKDVSDVSAPKLASGKTANLDLNGFIVTMDKTITNEGTLTITGAGELANATTSVITNRGILKKEGTSEIKHTATSGHAINSSGSEIIISDGVVSTTGGVIQGTNNTTANGPRAISTTGNFTMTGGTVKSSFGEAVYVTGNNVNVTGGTIEKGTDVNGTNHTGSTFLYAGNGTATFSGGTIKTTSGGSGTLNYSGTTGTIIVDGATIINEATGIAVVNGGKSEDSVIINSGTITATSSQAIRNNSTGTIKINGGTISSVGPKVEGGSNPDTINASSGKYIITGGTIRSEYAAAISIGASGNMTITGGTIIGKTYGVWMANASTPILNIGLDDGTVSQVSPSITGTNYDGIYTAGTASINFYDGIITGPTNKAITGTTTPPSGYAVVKTNSGTTQTAILQGTYTVLVDPNGGIYNGSTSPSSYAANSGTNMNINNPTRDGYTFGGWIPTKDEYDATWAEVFYHNNHSGTVLFSSENNWQDALSADTVDKYSILGQLEKFRTNTSQPFEFLLQYDEIAGKYNRWQQTANPATTTVANGTGSETAPGYTTNFTGGHVDWTAKNWGGLTLSTSGSTFINGSVGTGSWFYAIGTKTAWSGGIPGPNDTSIKQGAYLWVKVNSDLSNITQQVTGVVKDNTYIVKHDIKLKAIWIPN